MRLTNTVATSSKNAEFDIEHSHLIFFPIT